MNEKKFIKTRFLLSNTCLLCWFLLKDVTAKDYSFPRVVGRFSGNDEGTQNLSNCLKKPGLRITCKGRLL